MEIYNIDEAKIHITPLAVSSPQSPIPSTNVQSPNHNFPTYYILSLATLEPRKNQISIIEAYEAYRDQTDDKIHLVIGGGGGWKSQHLVTAAKQSKYAEEIHLIGYVDEQQKTELYRQAQVFVFPSFYEGFGLPVLEAMTAGCPVIASHTSSLPELVGAASLLIDPYNVNDLTAAMKLVLTSDRLRKTLITKGLERAKNFNWESTSQKTLMILQSFTE